MTTTRTTPATPVTPAPKGTNGTLPHRPQLLPGLPVLRRMAGETQIGTDPRHAVVVSGLPEPVAALLHDLTGHLTLDELTARAGPPNAPVLHRTLAGLASAGLLHDATAPPDLAIPAGPARLSADRTVWALRGHDRAAVDRCRESAMVVIHGSGRVAVALATLLAAAGVGWVHAVSEGVVQPADTGTGYLDEDIGRSRAEAIARAVRRTTPETTTARPDPNQALDLVVLADTTVPDPRVSTGLAVAGLPHLVVHAAEGTGMVGPLVEPGRTGCLHCADLRGTDRDPCWPALAAQLAAHPRATDLVTAQATAAFAAGQVLGFLHAANGDARRALPVWGAAVAIDVAAARTTTVTCPPHPRCPCGVGGQKPPNVRPGTEDPFGPIPST